jgi:DNA polymerase III delta prime subunit
MNAALDPLQRSPALVSLARAARGGELPNSVLLEGPEGCGKQEIALALAEILLEEEAGKSRGRVARLSHPDLLFVFPAQANLNLETYREILDAKATEPLARIRQASTAIIAIGEVDNPGFCTIRRVRRFAEAVPFEAPYKVVILADAHRMNRAAANALLKTLEEPPATAILLLCSHQTHLMPATVRSRCARVRIPAFSEEELVKRLIERHGLKEDSAEQIAAVSGGNARRALDLIDPQSLMVASWARSLLVRLLAAERAELLAGAERVSKGQDPEGGKGSKLTDASLSASRDVALRTIDFLVADLLSLVRLREGFEENRAMTERLSKWLHQDLTVDVGRAAKILLRARDDLALNVNVGLVLTHAFMEALDPAAARGSA